MHYIVSINSVILLLCLSQVCFGLEYNKQRYNPNTDFLLHEAGGNVEASKNNNIASNKAPSNNPNTGNVNTQQSTGKINYASQFPPLGTPSVSTSTIKPQTKPEPSNKRDYVAPNFPPLKNTQGSPGKVKDLVNFFDNKDNDRTTAQKTPSYSSVLQGSNGQNNSPKGTISTSTAKPTVKPQSSGKRDWVAPQLPGQSTSTRAHTMVTQAPQSVTTKPPSFSAVVSGSNKPGETPTANPSKPNKPGHRFNSSPTPRPSTILPSAIVNNNRNTNQGNNANGPTDLELQTLSEELLRKDTNNAAKYVTVNYQEKTTSQATEDKAPLALLTISPDAWNIPTIQTFLPLLDNYERDTLVNEHVTPQERNEENAFLDAIMSTAVIRHLMTFLKDKGYVALDQRQQRDFLKQMWFGLYSRGKGKISSSGFEHIFVSEFRNGEVLGLHNWIYFAREEAANRVNYLGYLKYLQLNDKGVVMKLHFNQQGLDKPVDTMFIGTSPELEVALYTLCFVTRTDNDCNLKLGSKDVNIRTYNFRYRSKNYIGSAFPQI